MQGQNYTVFLRFALTSLADRINLKQQLRCPQAIALRNQLSNNDQEGMFRLNCLEGNSFQSGLTKQISPRDQRLCRFGQRLT